MIGKLVFATPVALTLGALLTSPAAAAAGNNPGAIRSEIAQLDRQIDRARGLSQREERQLSRAIDTLQQQYRSFARGGFDRGEIRTLSRGIDNVRADFLRATADHRRDWRKSHR